MLNYEWFSQLSIESQEHLCSLLPPTFFVTFQPTVDPTHPSTFNQATRTAVLADHRSGPSLAMMLQQSPATLDPAFFTAPFFLSASKTFQDHLYSSWLTNQSKQSATQCEEILRQGIMHAEWKDAVWEREYLPQDASTASPPENDLASLAKRFLLRTGDVLAYKRHFAIPGVTVEKDLLVTSVHPQSYAVILLLQPVTTRALPPNLLVVDPPDPQPPIRTMDGAMSSEEIEDGILDVDGRVSRADRYATLAELVSSAIPNENQDILTITQTFKSNRAAKALTIYRWRDDGAEDQFQDRGGREPIGTVFYLRNS